MKLLQRSFWKILPAGITFLLLSIVTVLSIILYLVISHLWKEHPIQLVRFLLYILTVIVFTEVTVCILVSKRFKRFSKKFLTHYFLPFFMIHIEIKEVREKKYLRKYPRN